MAIPTEDDMRSQMFNTMAALERMAKAVTDHLTADKQPSSTEQSPDYSEIRVACPECHGVVQFSDYNRDYNSHQDTCTCEYVELRSLGLPSDVVAVFEAVRAAPCGPRGEPGVPGPPADLTKIEEVLDKHRKALAIIASCGTFNQIRQPFPMEPGRLVRDLVGLVACLQCGGTGWLARDESCKDCNRKGYLKA